jgi:predicted choloylglycine hydrolase
VSPEPAELEFRAIDEPQPGRKWQALFQERWPAYREWFLREGDGARPTQAAAARALRRHMPEIVPLHGRLAALAGGGQRAARSLSLYRPPPFLVGCSQAIWVRQGEVALVRNYDYAPRL